MSSWRLDFYTVKIGSKLIKFCFHCIFSVEEYISQKKMSFWSIRTRIYSIPNENKPGRVILLAQMPPVLLSVFRRGKNLSNFNMSWFYFARGIGASIKGLFTWRWGTPGRWGTPPTCGKRKLAFTCNIYNPGALGWGYNLSLIRACSLSSRYLQSLLISFKGFSGSVSLSRPNSSNKSIAKLNKILSI